MKRELILALILVPGLARAQKHSSAPPSLRAALEERGPVPPWFFAPRDMPGIRYGEAGIRQGQLVVDFKIQAENGHESNQKTSAMLDERLQEIGFVRMVEKSETQFNLWRYKKPKMTSPFGPPNYYVCKDSSAFKEALANLEFLDDRNRGKTTANVRQIFLKVRNLTGAYEAGLVSNYMVIQPVLVGTVTWADGYHVKEDLVPSLYAFNRVFEPALLLDQIEKTIKVGLEGSKAGQSKFRQE